MKPTLHFQVMTAACIVAVAMTGGAAGEDKELAALRTRYQAAVESATTPLRNKYLVELEEMKKRALERKDLDAAVKVDEEIKLIKPAPQPGQIRSADDLSRYLADSTWSWGRSESDAVSRLTFRRDGTCVINKDAPVSWSVVDEKTVKMGDSSMLKFNANHQRFTADTPLGKRAGKKL